MNNIYELLVQHEECTHMKVVKLADSSPTTHVVGDLGIYVEVDGEQQFQPQYSNAALPKNELINYVEPVQEP